MKSRTSIRLFLLVLRYAPAVMLVLIVTYCALRIFGVNILPALEAFARYSLPTAVLFWLASDSFGFCALHKAFIAYDYAACLCVDYHHVIGFSAFPLHVAHGTFVILGVMLLGELIILKTKGDERGLSGKAGKGCTSAGCCA